MNDFKNDFEFEKEVVDEALLDNPEPRCPVVLLLDTSYSMTGNPINQLNEGVHALYAALRDDDLASVRVDLSVISFGQSVQVLQNFATVSESQAPTLAVNGMTPMGEAITTALKNIEARKNEYRAAGISYYRPWLFVITDGEPTDSVSEASSMLQQAIQSKKVIFFGIGVESANIERLRQIAGSRDRVFKLNGLNFKELFQWVSSSLSSVSSSRVGDTIKLEKPSDDVFEFEV
ncbi:MAG TPA: VWA domain-containing protein [Acholeplasmataceae bacterium]|nr:VWA domain-containing protein [Acholeplasmataceae bacterium]